VIGLQLRFLAGRFHGNAWHHAHNEGIAEWPPSPWRVIRALVSAAYCADRSQSEVEPLLEKLRGLPRYRLPLATNAHTRHYVPDTDDANHKKSKVFDNFIAIEGGARDPQLLTMAWPVELTVTERALLETLCVRISYIGRAESWAEVKMVDVTGDQWDCWPDEEADAVAATNLLTLSPVEEFAIWAGSQAKPKKGNDVPRTLWDILTFDGARFRDEGWSAVPGTQLTRYVFAHRPFRRAPIRATAAVSIRPTVARFAIRSAVLPRMHEALALGERLRKAVMSRSKDKNGEVKAVFSGHGVGAGEHQHAMYLSSADDPRNLEMGFVDHLVIAARGGFDEDEIVALQRVKRLWGRGGHDLDLILVGLGSPGEIGGNKLPQTPILGMSRIWESITPFVPPRHQKRVRGVDTDTVEIQLRRCCKQLLNGVEPIHISTPRRRVEWSRFRRRRLEGGGSLGMDRAFGARLVFEQPQRGPIALGYGAHFGLGLFVAVEK